MPKVDSSWFERLRPEDPRRMRAFRARTEALSWDANNCLTSLSRLFAAVDELAESEVQYYYRRRGTRAWVSGVARMGAWLLGTMGLLLPLLAGTESSAFKDIASYGYVFLAASASCLAANSLFGGTDGHVRFVATQLELEKLIVASRVGWCKYLAAPSSTSGHLAEGFDQILAYASALHAVTIGETGRWGETLMTELGKYQRAIASKGPAAIKED